MSLYRSLTEEQRATMTDNDGLSGSPQIPGRVEAQTSSTPSEIGGNGARSVPGVVGGHTNGLTSHQGGAAGGDVANTNRNNKRYEKNSEDFANGKPSKPKTSGKFKSKGPGGKQQQHYQTETPPRTGVGKSKPSFKPKGHHGYNPGRNDYHDRTVNSNNYPPHWQPPIRTINSNDYPPHWQPPVRKQSPTVGGNGGLKSPSLSAGPTNLPHSSSSSSNGIENPRKSFSSRKEMLATFTSQMCPNVTARLPTLPKQSINLFQSMAANGDDQQNLETSSLGTTPKSEAGSIRKAIDPEDADINDSITGSEDDNGNENLISVNSISESIESLTIGLSSELSPPPKSNASKYQTDLDAIFATTDTLDYEPITPVKTTHSVNPNMTPLLSASAHDVNNGNATPMTGKLGPTVTSSPLLTQTPLLVPTMTPKVENSSSTSTASSEGAPQTLRELMAKHKKELELAKSDKQVMREQQNSQKTLFNKSIVPRTILEQTRLLPIFSRKDKLLELVRENQFIIVIGETGSGKSTQIPQYLAEAGFHRNGKIGVTQPRRVAAKSLADRVACETGVKVGTAVGYAVRFDKKISGSTVIKYMTDGLLVKECATEANLDTYSIIIIDEAHERSIHTDVCFGLLKRATRKRPELKVIISSATLEQDKFARYFNAPVFNVTGKGFEVETIYNPITPDYFKSGVVETIININRREPRGDILVFLSGQDEIEDVWDSLLEKLGQIDNSLYDELWILPCYGNLPLEEQQKIFEETPANVRKVVLATNIAETSLTVEGIVYVIDSGFFKQNEYNAKSGIYSLVKQRITKFQAIQRAGRAGRTRAGKCIRLYSERDFDRMKNATSPEITRSNVESVILDLISIGISNPLDFEFMDMPPTGAIAEAIEHLMELGALNLDFELTPLGRRMSQFPLEPSLSKVVLESEKLGCSADVLKIVALLSTQYQNLFSWDRKQDEQNRDKHKAEFSSPDGDLICLLAVYNGWLGSHKSEEWCQSKFIQHRILAEAEEIRQQLKGILTTRGISNYYGQVGAPVPSPKGSLHERIRRAFTAGYFRQLAKKKIRHAYQVIGDPSAMAEAYLHPSSSLFKQDHKHQWVIYHEVMKTSKIFMRGVIAVDPSWVTEYAPMFAEKVAEFGVPMPTKT